MFAALVSNTFKVEKFHSLVLWKHHNPLDIKEHEVRVNVIQSSSLLSFLNNRKLKKRRRRRQQERQKSSRFIKQNNNFVRAYRIYWIKRRGVFLAFPMQRLFKGGIYFEITFFKITDNSYCKSFVNTM